MNRDEKYWDALIGKFVKIVWKVDDSVVFYTGTITNNLEDCIDMTDIKGHNVSIVKEDISIVENKGDGYA